MARTKAELKREIEEAFGLVKGWANIARLVGCSRNTLMARWREWGLPIVFLGGTQRKTPAIYLDHLLLWRSTKLEETYRSGLNRA
ncbi:hypothetical protein HNQ76_001024 [Thermosulfuriphilus ammonigenes]|uniref:hypothetical protein n=1 Tax=Thermosulfuriphilus ammonigenes TaxID=1936021 RepID=UPI0015EBFD85|nr:hypothetical protein [Thermosulfuriphilus ammonigenes]MBA2848678.1 hypothetical protein [Thermosulfuriphilus ammonigenes]